MARLRNAGVLPLRNVQSGHLYLVGALWSSGGGAIGYEVAREAGLRRRRRLRRIDTDEVRIQILICEAFCFVEIRFLQIVKVLNENFRKLVSNACYISCNPALLRGRHVLNGREVPTKYLFE